MKFLIEIKPEFDESVEEVREAIIEGALRGNNFHGTVNVYHSPPRPRSWFDESDNGA